MGWVLKTHIDTDSGLVQGSLHYATLTGLAPNTKDYYRYGDSALALFSQEYSFTTPPVPSAAATVNFLAWADAGQAVADNTNEYDYYDVSAQAAPYNNAMLQYSMLIQPTLMSRPNT